MLELIKTAGIVALLIFACLFLSIYVLAAVVSWMFGGGLPDMPVVALVAWACSFTLFALIQEDRGK